MKKLLHEIAIRAGLNWLVLKHVPNFVLFVLFFPFAVLAAMLIVTLFPKKPVPISIQIFLRGPSDIFHRSEQASLTADGKLKDSRYANQ